jgi:hypothetical protein
MTVVLEPLMATLERHGVVGSVNRRVWTLSDFGNQFLDRMAEVHEILANVKD